NDGVEHRLELLAQEYRVGLRLGHVGSRDWRQRYVGGREGWRIVEAVADHQHAAATSLERFDAGDFLRRFQAALPLLDVKSACDRCDRLDVVAGENMQVEPAPTERIDHIGCVRAE